MKDKFGHPVSVWFLKVSLLIAALTPFSSLNAAQMAFIGDSLSTGGAVHPDLMLTGDSLSKLLLGELKIAPDSRYFETLRQNGIDWEEGGAEPPIRLFPSNREFRQPLLWLFDTAWLAFNTRFLDAEQFSWSYLLARSQGVPPEQMLIAAKDGERMEHARTQLDRVLSYTKGELPEQLFIFFTGNDICAPSFDFSTTPDTYADQLRDALKYYLRALPPGTSSIKSVWVVDPLGLLQIVSSQDILSHRVPYAKGERSCKQIQSMRPGEQGIQIQTGDPIQDTLFSMLIGTPAGYCPTLFSVHKTRGSESRVAIADRILGYRKSIEKVVEEMKPMFASRNVKLHQIIGTRDILFEGTDMANDCFHLNLNGHIKIYQAIKDEIENNREPRI